MHRGTTVEDAGYKVGTSWPIVPDIQNARDGQKYIKHALLAAVPLMAVSFLILMLSGVPLTLSLIGPAVVAIAITVTVLRLKNTVRELLINCKMIKVVAGLADAEVEHTSQVIFEAVTRKGETERIAPINEKFGVYVNAGYKMDDGRVELPYIIFIKKVDAAGEVVEEESSAA